MNSTGNTSFVPQLAIAHGTMDLSFYQQAFDAVETKHITNEDGSIHVSEMFIDGAMIHFHEESWNGETFHPGKYKGVTTSIGLMVKDVDAVIAKAIAAGAKQTSPATSYDYGYRQGALLDPLGHHWIIEAIL